MESRYCSRNKQEDLAKMGDNERKQIVTELTLECCNEKRTAPFTTTPRRKENRSCLYKQNLGAVTVTASTVTVTQDAHAGVPIVLNRAAGVTATPRRLPARARYEFILAADASGNQGCAGCQLVRHDDGRCLPRQRLGGKASCFYTADSSDTITLNGSTKGGLKGARVIADDITANVWAVLVYSEASGTEATPFSRLRSERI